MEFWHSIKLPDGTYTDGKANHGPNGGVWPEERFGLPKDLKHKSLLDIGCYDGFFSFLAEERGAQVIASDIELKSGFWYFYKALNSKIGTLQLDIASSHEFIEPFDVVLCYGVLYHIKSPLLAMYNLGKWTKELCLIETAITEDNEKPTLEYRPGYDDDPFNYFYPNRKWIELSARECGFKDVQEIYREGPTGHTRATYRLTKGGSKLDLTR